MTRLLFTYSCFASFIFIVGPASSFDPAFSVRGGVKATIANHSYVEAISKEQSRRALRGRARSSRSSSSPPPALTSSSPSLPLSMGAKTCRGSDGVELLPPLKRIIWRENYNQLVNATMGSGKEFASGINHLRSLAKDHPAGFEVLVIGGRGDATVPSSFPLNQWLEIQGAGAHVLYAWNYNATAWQTPGKPVPKGVVGKAVPLGLDFHTLDGPRTQRGKTWWGEPKQSPGQQYGVLCNLRIEVSTRAQRTNRYRILAPFRIVSEPIREIFYETHGIPTRVMVWQALNGTGLADEMNYKSRREVWAEMGNYGFVVSPVGHGLDAHRTWEALAMGAIVLTESSPLDAMFTENQLPVYAVKSVAGWAGLDLPRLREIARELGPWTEPAHLLPRLDARFWFTPPAPNARRRLTVLK